MTDALMPHGLSCLSKLLNRPQTLPPCHVLALPRRFRCNKSLLHDNAKKSHAENGNLDEEEDKLPSLKCSSLVYRENSCRNEQDEDDDELDKQTHDNPAQISFTPKADMVRRDHTGSLEECAGLWQEIAPSWDRIQIRFNRCRPYEIERRSAKLQCTIERPFETKNKPRKEYVKVIDPLTKKEVQFTKQVPGYCGYVPRYPVLPKPPETCKNPGFKSISKSTYRKFPSYEYKKQTFAHKGPLSSNVTTTAPFNPYNKLDLICLNGKRLIWKRPILELVNIHMKQR